MSSGEPSSSAISSALQLLTEQSSPQSSAPGPAIQDSNHFQSPDADLVVVSAGNESDSGALIHSPHRFKVHRDKLRAASPIFADMFRLGNEEDGHGGAASLPCVQMTENTPTLEMLLRYIYANDISVICDLADSSSIRLLDIFEAAAKYQMPALQFLAETSLR